MDSKAVWAAARAQLALDLGCDPALLDSPDNEAVLWQDRKGRRMYCADTPFLELAVWNGKLIASCRPSLQSWIRENLLPCQAEWLFLPRNFRRLEAGLAPFGYELGDARHFYLPVLPCAQAVPQGPVCWYEQEALEQFRDADTWSEALAFNPFAPDMLAVAALDKSGSPIAMAGASRDGAHLWQIGIRVLPAYQGQGLGANLTALLKDELLRRGIVPLYSTAESHIISQHVALRAGFSPAFGYLYARRMQTKGT